MEKNSKKTISLLKLEIAIKNNNMMKYWEEGLFTETEEDRINRSNSKREEAIKEFKKIMNSPKNKGTERYEVWAINSVLGIRSRSSISTKVGRY